MSMVEKHHQQPNVAPATPPKIIGLHRSTSPFLMYFTGASHRQVFGRWSLPSCASNGSPPTSASPLRRSLGTSWAGATFWSRPGTETVEDAVDDKTGQIGWVKNRWWAEVGLGMYFSFAFQYHVCISIWLYIYIYIYIYIYMYVYICVYIYAHVQCCRRLLNFVKSCVVCASLQDEKSIWNQFRKAENQAPETAGSWTRGTM